MQVSKDEYLDVLDAYGVISEEERVKGKPSVGKWTLILLASWLEEWNLTIDEIFDLFRTNTIDTDEFIQKVV